MKQQQSGFPLEGRLRLTRLFTLRETTDAENPATAAADERALMADTTIFKVEVRGSGG